MDTYCVPSSSYVTGVAVPCPTVADHSTFPVLASCATNWSPALGIGHRVQREQLGPGPLQLRSVRSFLPGGGPAGSRQGTTACLGDRGALEFPIVFATLEEYSEATGQDRNSVQVGYDVFMNVPALDARNVSTLQNLYDAEDLDFRLRPGSAAIDWGMVLPSVTDGFTGSAPDLGALEVGGAAPHYGPRD